MDRDANLSELGGGEVDDEAPAPDNSATASISASVASQAPSSTPTLPTPAAAARSDASAALAASQIRKGSFISSSSECDALLVSLQATINLLDVSPPASPAAAAAVTAAGNEHAAYAASATADGASGGGADAAGGGSGPAASLTAGTERCADTQADDDDARTLTLMASLQATLDGALPLLDITDVQQQQEQQQHQQQQKMQQQQQQQLREEEVERRCLERLGSTAEEIDEDDMGVGVGGGGIGGSVDQVDLSSSDSDSDSDSDKDRAGDTEREVADHAQASEQPLAGGPSLHSQAQPLDVTAVSDQMRVKVVHALMREITRLLDVPALMQVVRVHA